MITSCCYVTKHRETLPAGTAKNSMSHRKMFVPALFKNVFHLIFNAKIMSILEITFGISFICNDLDLTEILLKAENALSRLRQFTSPKYGNLKKNKGSG